MAAGGLFLLQLLALLCYEAAIVFPCLLILRDLWMRTRPPVAKDTVIGFTFLAVACGIYLILRRSAAGTDALENLFIRSTNSARLAFASGSIAMDHLLLWLAPFGRQQMLRSFSFDPSSAWMLYGASWAAVALLFVLAVRWRRRVPEFTYGMAWFAIAYFPTSNVFPLFNGPYADYCLVVPGIGLAAAFTGGLRRVWELRPASGGQGLQVLLILLILWRLAAAGEAVKWSAAWRSDQALLEARTKNSSLEIAPYVALTQDLSAKWKAGPCLRPDARAGGRIGICKGVLCVHADAAQRLGHVDEAIQTHRAVIETLHPAHPYPYTALGHLPETHRNDQAGAVSAYRQAS